MKLYSSIFQKGGARGGETANKSTYLPPCGFDVRCIAQMKAAVAINFRVKKKNKHQRHYCILTVYINIFRLYTLKIIFYNEY